MKDTDDPPSPDSGEIRESKVSRTAPDSGLFYKTDKEKCFAYSAHTPCDRHNFILYAEITVGKIHDSVGVDASYNEVKRKFDNISEVVVAAGYKTPWIAK